jgi:hypothetical protein
MNTPSIHSAGIRIMLGLPHLRDGPLLARARALCQPVLVSANAFSRWSRRTGVREWAGWSTGSLRNASGLHSLSLDSAGFSAMVAYGGYPWTIDDYLDLVAAHPFAWWASLDYCVEHQIAADRDEVLDRMSRTIRATIDCRTRARDRGIEARFLPVIQGRRPQDYERCADALSLTIQQAALIGVGSMCRRPIHGPEGLVAVVDHLDQILPRDKRLHLFGVKGEALPYLTRFARRIASIDSQAYGIGARIAARRSGHAKPEHFVAEHMAHWLLAQQARLRAMPRALPIELVIPADPAPDCPWQAAISRARAEIRALIEQGELDHDAMTTGWIEQWAADIYRDQRSD